MCFFWGGGEVCICLSGAAILPYSAPRKNSTLRRPYFAFYAPHSHLAVFQKKHRDAEALRDFFDLDSDRFAGTAFGKE